jgi:hypothetical protein
MDAKFYKLMDEIHKPWWNIKGIVEYFEPLRVWIIFLSGSFLVIILHKMLVGSQNKIPRARKAAKLKKNNPSESS